MRGNSWKPGELLEVRGTPGSGGELLEVRGTPGSGGELLEARGTPGSQGNSWKSGETTGGRGGTPESQGDSRKSGTSSRGKLTRPVSIFPCFLTHPPTHPPPLCPAVTLPDITDLPEQHGTSPNPSMAEAQPSEVVDNDGRFPRWD